jgi:hypothetical protein
MLPWVGLNVGLKCAASMSGHRLQHTQNTARQVRGPSCQDRCTVKLQEQTL